MTHTTRSGFLGRAAALLLLASGAGCSTLYDLSYDQTVYGGTRHNLELMRGNCQAGDVWTGMFDFVPSLIGDTAALPLTLPVGICRCAEDRGVNTYGIDE